METSSSDDRGPDSGDPVVGHRIGHLVAKAVITDNLDRPQYVLFACDCGRQVRIGLLKIRRGKFRDACKNCWKPPKRKPGRPLHPVPVRDHPAEYAVWYRIKDKARGKWRTSFEKFFKDMGPRPTPDSALQRYNRKEPYYPSNCYWGLKNLDRMSSPLTYKGEPTTPSWVTRKFGIRRSFVMDCRKRGMTSVENILKAWHNLYPGIDEPLRGPEGLPIEERSIGPG